MKKYIGVEVRIADNKLGKIVDAYSCYDGEFFIIKFSELNTIHMNYDSPIIRRAIEEALLSFEKYSCVLIRHSESYNKKVLENTLKDDILIYDNNMKLVTTVSKITEVNDWFAANVYRKEEDTLLVDSFCGYFFRIDMKNLSVIESRIGK